MQQHARDSGPVFISHRHAAAKTNSAHAETSHSDQVETVLPSHTNMHGTAFGGTVMSWIDSCASLSASRGGRCAVVAAGFDEIAFVAPLRLGEHAVIDSKVTRSWGTSLEVRVTRRLTASTDCWSC